jgi:hypothetical protein
MANKLATDTAPDLQRLLDDAEMMQNLELIKNSRESLEESKRHFVDSFGRLVETQNLVRRLGERSVP